MKYTNEQDLLEMFINGSMEARGSSLTIGGPQLFSYSTIIAKRMGSILFINSKRYSRTTSRATNYLKNNAKFFLLVEEEDIQRLSMDELLELDYVKKQYEKIRVRALFEGK